MTLKDYTEYKTPEGFVKHNLDMATDFIEHRIEPLNDTLPDEMLSGYVADRLKTYADKRGLRDFIWLFACTSCGADRLPTPILNFYHYHVEKLKCYDCQGRRDHA